MNEIPDGRPYMVGRDFTVGERFPLQEGDRVGYDIDGEIHTGIVTDHCETKPGEWTITVGGPDEDPVREAGDRFRAAMEAIRDSFTEVDFAGAAESIREFVDSYKQAQESESAPHPLHPAIKKPSHTPPVWAINVGKAKRNPRSTRRVK